MLRFFDRGRKALLRGGLGGLTARLCIVLALVGAASMAPVNLNVARAQFGCGFNQVECDDGLCYVWGSSCCRGGLACSSGSECWATDSGTKFCCPTGTDGYNDGGCAPSGISDYCGNSTYCTKGICTSDGRCQL